MHKVCVCTRCGDVNHAECAPALPPLSCPCAPLGVQPLMAIDTGESCGWDGGDEKEEEEEEEWSGRTP